MSHAFPRRHVVTGLAALGFLGRVPGAGLAQAAPSQQPASPLAERLAAYADRLSYGDLDAATIERVKSHLIDTLGCGIAAFDEEPVRISRDIVLAIGGGVSTIIGTNRRAPPDLAAFANGAAFRYYDLNNVYVGRQASHPSDNIRPVSRSQRPSGRAQPADHRDRARL